MKKAFRKILRIGAVAASLVILAVIAAVLLFFFNKPLVKNILLSQLGKRTGVNISAGRLDYSLFPFHLTVEALELGLENDFQKWDASLARLEAEGSFWKLVRGTKPAIDKVEAEGAVVNLEQKAFPEVPLDLRAILLQTSDTLALARQISIANSRLTASLPSQDIRFDNFDISLTPSEVGSTLAFAISRSNIEVKNKVETFSLRSRLTSSGALRLGSPLGFEAAFTLDAPQILIGGIKHSPGSLTIDSSGRFDPGSKELIVSKLKIGVPDLLDVEGTAGGKFGRDFALNAEATARCNKLENLAALLEPRLPAALRRTRLRGRVVLTGKYEIQRSGRETIDNLDGSLAFDGIEFDYVLKGLPLHVRASGKVQASGPSRAPRLSADIRSSLGKIAWGNLTIGDCDLNIVVAATARQAITISRLEGVLKDIVFNVAEGKSLSLDNIGLAGRAVLNLNRREVAPSSMEAGFSAAIKNLFFGAGEGESLSFDNVTLKGKAGFDAAKKTAVLSSLEARFPGIAPLFIEGQYGLGKKRAGRALIESRGQDIPALRALAAPFVPEGLAGWDLGGTADLSVEVRRPAASGRDWGFSGSLSFAQARLNDPLFVIAGEGLNPVLKVEAEYDDSRIFSFKGTLDIDQGESLWKEMYVSWTKHPLKLAVDGRYLIDSGAVDGLDARFLFPTIGEVQLSGSIKRRPQLSFDLRTDTRLRLGPLYSLYSQAGVSQEERMTVEGMLGAGFHILKEGDDLSITGKVTLVDANIERPASKTALFDVDAELPVLHRSGKAATGSPQGAFPERGFLRIAEFRNRFTTLKLVDIPLRAGADAFSMESFSVELYGGRLEFGRTVFHVDPRSGLFQGIGSLTLHDLDISRLPIRSPQFKLTGKIQADFPKLDISPKEIAVSGRGEADVFGGKVVLRDLAVSEPFSPGRSFSLNIDLLDLDLKKLTDEIPFGEVTGIVRGEVRNLVISYGQPERFDFRIESVPRKGVPQTFSLKAVDNLTVLSSGEQASVGTSQFWMRFIRGFRYEKLGIVSTLRNDTFTLNGTIHEGGVEYLVKKPRFFGINVINRMPEKLISFKEMTSRLRRVGQSEK